MVDANKYFEVAKEYLDKARTTQRDVIHQTAKMMGDCMLENGIVQLFGLGAGRAFSMELGYRAGGLMPFHQINMGDLLLRGVITPEVANDPRFEDNSAIAEKLWNMYNIHEKDMFILISNAGNKEVIVEFAHMVKARGHKLVVVTSKEEAKLAKTTHKSGKNLMELADIVIDNCAGYPDTVIDMQGLHINQISTVTGNVIAQMLTAETYRYLTGLGQDCPVLLSANVKGADVHNREISDKYIGRWNS